MERRIWARSGLLHSLRQRLFQQEKVCPYSNAGVPSEENRVCVPKLSDDIQFLSFFFFFPLLGMQSLYSQLLLGQQCGLPSFNSSDASLRTPDSVSLKFWHFHFRHIQAHLLKWCICSKYFKIFSLRLMGLFTTFKLSIKMILSGYSCLLSAPVLLPHGIGCL